MNKPADLPLVDLPASTAPSHASLAMIDRLIGFPTVSRDSNLGLIEFARDELARLGVRSNLIYDAARNKANLFATLSAEPDRLKTGGLVISGHTDTVPVDGQDWSSDPFVGESLICFATWSYSWTRHRRHERLHRHRIGGSAEVSRGTGKTAAALSLTYDEETTFFGVRDLLADLADRGIRPAGCIIGEPTDMRAIVAHKGKRDLCCRVRGREAHSSLTPEGVNAIEFAARLVAFIRQTADRLSREETRDARFAVPYTTLQTGVIQGGIAVNIVPRDCEFTFEMRNLPATSTDEVTRTIVEYAERELVPEMRRVANDAGIAFECAMDLPAFGIAVGSSAGALGTTGREHHASKRWGRRFRDRGQHVFECRHSHRGDRTGQHRPGAQARRIHQL